MVLGLDLVLRQINDGVILFDLDQHLFAIGGDLVAIRITKDGFLPVLETVGAEVRLVILIGAVFVFILVVRDRAPQVEETVADHAKVAVVGRSNLEDIDPILDAVGIDLYDDRFLGLVFFTTFLLRIFGLLLLSVFVLFLGFADLVAPRREG